MLILTLFLRNNSYPSLSSPLGSTPICLSSYHIINVLYCRCYPARSRDSNQRPSADNAQERHPRMQHTGRTLPHWRGRRICGWHSGTCSHLFSPSPSLSPYLPLSLSFFSHSLKHLILSSYFETSRCLAPPPPPHLHNTLHSILFYYLLYCVLSSSTPSLSIKNTAPTSI